MRKEIPLVGVVFLVFTAIALSGCTGEGGGPSGIGQNWMYIALGALTLSYLMIAVAYMYAIGFQDSGLEAWCKNEFYQTIATAVILGVLIGSTAILDNLIYPAFWENSLINPENERKSFDLCGDSQLEIYNIDLEFASLREPGGSDSVTDFKSMQKHSVRYIDCIRRKVTVYFIEASIMGSLIGVIQSLWISMDIEWIGGPLFISPGQIFKPVMDTISYVIMGLAGMLIQIIAQKEILEFSIKYMFNLILPVGIALRAFPFTRVAGGALIAISVGFYLVFPITYLIQEEVVAAYCDDHDCETSMLQQLFETGSIHEILKAMFESGQRGGVITSEFFGTDEASIAQLVSINGPLGPITFMTFVAGAIMPLFGLIFTLMFIKNLGTIMGAELDFSALLKII